MVDHQRQLDTATAFFLAGERCSFELKFGDYGFHSLSAPTIVNYAFSVELGLKLISVLVRGVSEKGHSLKRLYDALPLVNQTALPHLAECVDEIDRYFEEWRYPFEQECLFGDIANPRRAFIECYREIRRLKPELVSVYEENWGSFDPEWSETHAIRGPIQIIDRTQQ
ncbi:MAG: hypothetical protein Kow0026_22320 [Oricola sp.]